MRVPYEALIDFVPPRIMARTELGARLDPELLRLQEAARLSAVYPKCFDVKPTQLMPVGILLALMGGAARLHAIAARGAGASWEELSTVVGLTCRFRGLPAANLGRDPSEDGQDRGRRSARQVVTPGAGRRMPGPARRQEGSR
jgi:hypothetical protein